MAIFDFHLLKLEHALIFQVIGQKIYTPVFEQFKATNGWRINSDVALYPSISLSGKIIHLRSIGTENLEDLYHTSVIMFDDNNNRNTIYNEIMSALEEWALKARKLDEI